MNRLVLLLLAALTVWSPAGAQSYPSRPVHILVGTPAGGPLDMMARGTAQGLGQVLGQPFVVENRVGADSMIAGEACAKSAPEGYTLCVIDSLGTALNPVIRTKMPYDPSRDLAPIVHYGYGVNGILVHPSVPANTLQELFELARAKPGSISWGSYGLASSANLYIEWLRNAKGISFYNVPYKAASLAFPAMLAGEVQVSFFNLGQAAAHIKAGKAKALAVILGKRSSILPDVPTYKEAGLDIAIMTSFGLYAPAGTPREIVARLNAEVVNTLFNNADMKQKFLLNQGLELEAPAGRSPEEFAAYLKAERENYANIVRITRIKVE